MGWNIDIITDRPMSEELIEEIILDLPDSLSEGYGKTSWGWSLGVDVRLSNPNELCLSGSYSISGRISELAADAFAQRLQKLGFKTEIHTS